MPPNFQALWNGYPADASADDGVDHWPCLTKRGEVLHENQCAIRVSIALAAAGVNMKSCPKVKCWEAGHSGHVLRAQELADWLKAHLLGAPETWTIKKHGKKPSPGKQAETAVQGKTGIVFFQNFWGAGNSGDHIDLWNATEGKTISLDADSNYFHRSEQVWFWKLK